MSTIPILEHAPSRPSLVREIPPRLMAAVCRLPLTRREAAVTGLSVLGLRSKQVAQQLGISEATVRTHLSNCFRKCGVHSRVQLSALVIHDLLDMADSPSLAKLERHPVGWGSQFFNESESNH